MASFACALHFFTVSTFVDPRLETDDWRSFWSATQIIEMLIAMTVLEIIVVLASVFVSALNGYFIAATCCLLGNVLLCGFIWKSRLFRLDSHFKIPVRTRVKATGNGMVLWFFALETYSTLQGGVFSVGFCSLFALPLIAIIATGSKNSCLVCGVAAIASQQYALLLQGQGYQWPRPLLQATMSADLLIFNAVLCAVLDIFIIQVSMRFCLSHKKVNDVMQSTTEKVKQLLEEKANFIANATHELRTPMMQILGLVELLNTVNKDRDTAPLIETLRTATMSVIALVNDVLDYEKLGKGMIRLEQTSFDIRELIKRLLMMSAIHAHAKKIELMAVTCMRVPQFVIGDQMRLYQILQNLLNNAIKFTVPREETNEIIIKVDSCLVPNDSSRLQLDISVRDTGIGLSRDSIPYLFQAFRQASSSTSRLYGGTGLGLVISKNLAQVMNGDICVNSDGPGKGTVFNVAVQVGWQGAALDASMRLPIRSFEFGWTVRPASGTAVIFDDVPTALSLLEKATEELGFEVRSFNTFQSMTQFLLTKNPIPKLILVDIGTIGSTSESASGFASLEYIRKLDPVYENLHVIALKDQDDVLTVSTPYTCFYSKPIISEQIQATILSIISAEHKYSNGVSAKYEDSTNLHKGKRCRVLLVDDNTVNLKIIGRMIEQLGHEATLCSSSSSAFEILARNQSETHIAGQVEDAGNENPIDVIVTDFMMPEVNGIQLIQKIRRLERERPGCRVIPIILTSGNPKSTFEKDLESYAPASFMMKPFTIKELKESLENYCDRESNVTRTMHPP